jgi:hypothetical protein
MFGKNYLHQHDELLDERRVIFRATQGMSLPGNYFNGSMDEVKFYNGALTNKEIDYLLNH